jgi:hypothetical protein
MVSAWLISCHSGVLTEVVEHVLKDEEESDLRGHSFPRGERNLPGGHANGLCHRVEEPDLNEACYS